MRLILLGAPGTGKGTAAKMLTALDGSVQISTGDMLRAAIKENSLLGKQAESFMNKGELVPDHLIMEIMAKRLKEDDCQAGFLLDGFPRTIPQAEALKILLSELGMALDGVINLDVPREVILDRLTTRRTCVDCGAIYNVKSSPTKVAGVCDLCGGKVVQRDDETEVAILRRLDVFKVQTAPLVGFYEKEGNLLNIRATTSQVVVETIKQHIGIR